jgi:hypothetical protein
MKDNYDGKKKFKPAQRRFASLSHYGFVLVGILSGILMLLATPVFAQDITSLGSCEGADCGVIKVCKVAGPGVNPTTQFSFTGTLDNNTVPFTLQAGPAPGGNCVRSGKLLIGSQVTVSENPNPGDIVSSITVEPLTALVTENPPTSVTVKVISNAVTEVTFTDQSAKVGYLEICKVAGAGVVSGTPFKFTVPGNPPVKVTVRAGQCSPAIPVSAGNVKITEVFSIMPHPTIVACSTFPNGRQVACTASTSTVQVRPGGISTQTIANITNAMPPCPNCPPPNK